MGHHLIEKYADKVQVKICERRTSMSSRLLTISSHDLGFHLRTYKSCHINIRNESSATESKRSESSIFHYHCGNSSVCYCLFVVFF